MPTGRGHGAVLVVEDQAQTRELLAIVLRRAGYEVICAADGEMALSMFERWSPDVVLLDLDLPGMSGWEVLAHLRRHSGVPICMVTGNAHDGSKVRGLNAGADDYLIKTTSPVELVARVGALLRRSRRPAEPTGPRVFDDGVVKVDFDACEVEVNGSTVRLTPLEFRLLGAFIRRPGVVLSRDDLLREVWHDDTGGSSDHVKTYVGYLRRKLPAGAQIETVRGFGYRYLAELAAVAT